MVYLLRKNIINKNFYLLIKEILRFYKQVKIDLNEKNITLDESLNDYLNKHGFSSYFTDHHLIPMGSLVNST